MFYKVEDPSSHITYYLNPVDEESCNWMMFVRRAQSWNEMNLMLYEVEGELFFVSIKTLQFKGHELKYGYAKPYAEKYDLKTQQKGEKFEEHCLVLFLAIS